MITGGITQQELQAFKGSVRIGDYVACKESASNGDGSGSRTARTKMQVTGKYKHIATLKSRTGRETSFTWAELAAIVHPKSPEPSRYPLARTREAQKQRASIILELYRSGMDRKEIATETGYSESTISNTLKGQGRKEADEERAARLQEKGLSVREIAQKLGKSKTTVQRLLKAYGQREKTE